jgi:hypothetical protein
LTTVLCIVAGDRDNPKAIGARACVEAQRDGRCFCLKGVPALQAVGPELEPVEGDDDRALSKKRKLREDLGVLKARCTGFLRKPPSQQYAGPAIAAAAGKPLAQQPLTSAVPLPPPPSSKDAAGATRMETSNALVRKTSARLNPTNVERRASAMSPAVGEPDRAASGVAEARRPMPPPQLDEREDEHEAAIAAQELSHATSDSGPDQRSGESLDRGKNSGRKPTAKPTSVVQPGPTGGRENRSGLSPCLGCGGGRERRNTSGYCAMPACQKALFKEREAAAPKCSVGACTRRAFGPSGKCSDCQNGVRPGSGLDPCATVGCPKKVQRWRRLKKCTLCRRGLKAHLKPKEQSMAKPNPLDAVSEADFKAAFQKHGGQFKATGKALGAAGSTVKRRAAELGLLGKKAGQTPPRSLRAVQKPESSVPAEAQKTFTGMPDYADVPIGWTVGFLKFLREQSVAVDGIGATAA